MTPPRRKGSGSCSHFDIRIQNQLIMHLATYFKVGQWGIRYGTYCTVGYFFQTSLSGTSHRPDQVQSGLYSRILDVEGFIFDSNPSTLRHLTERQGSSFLSVLFLLSVKYITKVVYFLTVGIEPHHTTAKMSGIRPFIHVS
jgi:hypothetical protein